ncbi:MAG: hypothetical protein U5K77_00105 [Candidatus Saccharibacteria bacterium]|nr:hypothetical protein [Candidatus Saccharibacteria bacterium]
MEAKAMDSNSKIIFWAITSTMVILSLLSYVLVTNPSTAVKFSFMVALLPTLFHFGAAYYFLAGIKYFKSKQRIAYILISTGMVVLGIAVMQLAIVKLFGLREWITSGGILIPYLASGALLFAGVRRFARLLNIKGLATSWLALLAVWVIASILFSFIPYVDKPIEHQSHVISLTVNTFNAVVFAFGAWGLLKIKKVIGKIYQTSLRWFYKAMLAAFLVAVPYSIVLLTLPLNHWYYNYTVTAVLFIVSSWLFMRAGYSFSRIGQLKNITKDDTSEELLGYKPKQSSDQESSILDVIVYISSLASDNREIDPKLDTVRSITSQLKPGEQPSAEAEKRLLSVYKVLENYLINDDKLQKLDKKRLRDAVFEQTGVKINELITKEND